MRVHQILIEVGSRSRNRKVIEICALDCDVRNTTCAIMRECSGGPVV